MSAINIAGSRLTLKGVGESHQGEGGNLEKLMEGLKRRFPSVDAAVLSFFKRRELLLLASVPPHNHREPCHPDASDDGHEPLLPRHAGKLEQDGVNPAHGSLAERPILGAGGAIRKAERGNMPDRVGAAAAGVGRARVDGLPATHRHVEGGGFRSGSCERDQFAVSNGADGLVEVAW